ncbi:MAG: DsrE family protein [Salinivirgaceae bacterium]
MITNTLLQINNFGMGQGDASLGLKLINNYFNLIINDEQYPQFVVFYNSGVKLLTQNSPAVDSLKKLAEAGVQLIACKTCIDHYQISLPLPVGAPGSMMDIIALQQKAEKIITL